MNKKCKCKHQWVDLLFDDPVNFFWCESCGTLKEVIYKAVKYYFLKKRKKNLGHKWIEIGNVNCIIYFWCEHCGGLQKIKPLKFNLTYPSQSHFPKHSYENISKYTFINNEIK